MKVIKVPYSNRTQSFLETMLTILVVCGITFMIVAIFKLDWKVFLIMAMITFSIGMLLWKIMTLQILILTRDFIEIKIITDIDDYGFTLYHNQRERRVYWKKVSSIHLKKNRILLIRLKSLKEIKIDHEYYRWYALLKKISNSKLKTTEISEFLEKTFRNLSTCKVCGSIAANHTKCLSCGSDCFNDKLGEEFENETAYIKSEQLELFCTMEREEKIDFHEEAKDGFEKDKNWKPIVTNEEVIEYSKTNY